MIRYHTNGYLNRLFGRIFHGITTVCRFSILVCMLNFSSFFYTNYAKAASLSESRLTFLDTYLSEFSKLNQSLDLYVDSTVIPQKTYWDLKGYFDFYLAKDQAGIMQNRDYGNIVSYSKLGEIQLNLAMIKLAFLKNDFRSNFAIGAGTYMMKNLVNEPVGLRNLCEANIGISLNKNNSTWFDLGVFPSHIGFESAIGFDCLNLTRSLLAENSPYYEAGCRIVGENKYFNWGAYVVNGWQTIYKSPSAQKGLSVGGQMNKKWRNFEFNYSNIITSPFENHGGNRYFHNLFVKWQSQSNWNVVAGFDIVKQKNVTGEKRILQSPILIVSKQKGIHRFALRAEQFKDPNQVMVENGFMPSRGVDLLGYSINYDCKIKSDVLLRFEARKLNNSSVYFQTDPNFGPSRSVSMFTIALQAKI